MSISIIYDKQFVSLGDGRFIPLMIIGDSSMTVNNGGREKTSRNWGCMNTNGKSCTSTLDQMMEAINNRRSDLMGKYKDYNDNAYGFFDGVSISARHPSKSTFGMLRGLFTTGAKKALTVEQLARKWVGLSVHTYIANTDKDRIAELGLMPLNRGFISTEDLRSFIDNEAPKYINAGVYLNFSLSLDAYDLFELKSLRKHFYPVDNKSHKSFSNNTHWIIEIIGSGFYKKGGSRKISITHVRELAKKYASEKSANSKIESLSQLYRQPFKTVKIEKKIAETV